MQVNSRALAFIITTMLSQKVQKACHPDQASETFLCEWSPLRHLLFCAQNILSKDQVGSNLELMNKQRLGKDSSSISQSLSQVLAIIKNGDFVRADGAAMALTSSIVCAMPEEILKNFPLLLNISHKIFENDYSVLLSLLCSHKELFGQIAEAWPDLFLSGLKLAGHSFSQKQDNSDHQTQENDLQDSAVSHGFNFSTMKLRTTEKQLESVSVSDACSEEWDPVAFASFMQSIPFSTLFTLCANSYQSRLLGFVSMKGILKAKISELSSDSFLNTLHLIMFWILQLESSWREGAHSKEQLETCFSLLKHLVVYVIEAFWSGQALQRPEEVIKTVLVHPAISMFMSKWMYSSILMNSQDTGAADIESVDLQCKKWKRKSDKTRFEIFLHFCQAKVHPVDNNILSILSSLMEIASSQPKISSGGALKQWDSFGRTIAEACKPFICWCLSVFKNELLESIKTDSYGIPPLPTFYILSILSPFISPFTLLELVHWLFSNNISEHQESETSAPGPKLPYAHIGFYFVTLAFKMFHAYLNQAKEDIVVHQFFWDMDGQKFDTNVIGEVYKKVIGVAMKQASESADLCLLSIMKAIHVQRSARVLPRTLPISIMLCNLISITPTEVVQHCINNTNQLKAKILLLLTQISTLHLTISGELIVANMTFCVPDAQLKHLGSALMISDKMIEENSDAIISENELVLLLPVTLRYVCSESRATEVSFLELSKKITSHYFKIIWKGFLKWDEYVCCHIFDIVQCDEKRCETAEDFASYFSDTLLGRAIYLLQAGFSSEKKSRKSRKKLLSSILPKGSSFLDHVADDINGSSFEQVLNMVNRVVANMSLARWLLFPKPSCLPLHQERKTNKHPGNGALKHSQENIRQSGAEECKMEPADYARLMNCLICTLDTLFQQFSVQSQESRYHSNLMSFMEKTILSHLVDVSMEMEVRSVDTQYLSSLKTFTKLTFLHRFEDPTVMKTLRCLILSLSQESCASDIVSQFATDALGFLMAHSHFIPTILWTGFISVQSFGQSDKGTMFRSLNGIVNLLALPSLSQHGVPNSEDIIISPGGHSQPTHQNSISNRKDSSFLEQRKLEVVKLVRVLYLLRVRKGSSSASVETTINIEELFSLLLAGYGATMSQSDLEIFTLMHEIELLEGSNFSGLSERNYLWGEAALKRRREQQDEKLLSKYNSVDDDETTVDRCKRQFRENLIFDPKVCGETVLYFPSKRSAWAEPIDTSGYVEESLRGMTVVSSFITWCMNLSTYLLSQIQRCLFFLIYASC